MAEISNPRKEFNFTIKVVPDPINPMAFQEVIQPDSSIEQALHGESNYDIKTPGRRIIGEGKLKKLSSADGADNYMWDWHDSCQSTLIGGGAVPDYIKKTLIITELGTDGHTPINTWVWKGCWPTKINGLSHKRRSSDNSIEEIDISVDSVEKA